MTTIIATTAQDLVNRLETASVEDLSLDLSPTLENLERFLDEEDLENLHEHQDLASFEYALLDGVKRTANGVLIYTINLGNWEVPADAPVVIVEN